MKRKITVEVKDKSQLEAIQRAVEHEDVRAFLVVVGTLAEFKSDRARKRILVYVADHFAERDESREDEER